MTATTSEAREAAPDTLSTQAQAQRSGRTPGARRFGDAFSPMGRGRHRSALLVGLAAFILLLLLWSAVSYSGMVDPLFLPTPSDTLLAGVTMFQSGFGSDIGITVFRVMGGFLIAAIIGIPLGVLVGTYAPVSSFLEPVFSFVRYMPASAFIPLFILWIGIDETEKIAIIILGSLPQIVLMVASNIRNVPMSLVEASYTLGTNRGNVLWKVIVPKASPDILDTLRIVLGWAWTYVIVAEIVGASSGIGYSILQSQRSMAVDQIFVAILTLGLIGLIVDNLLVLANHTAFKWNNVRESE
ncbi:ABC transporter permease [Acidipropionibacterium acidipropionici]|uniref:ABC transporter permease n=2 Tax=Acidipropionibacterium acidipropionici TaxID=1748 RepID=A0ABN4U426_9ACTN|nr:ABC transporter permease [Acidipropionibacterium acidipropionici]AOZ46903.1 ABC transporter permease [Acidipropionibacterium acidipropionici]AZP37015.1 ABC transporter permease [Acidipropionibacterium acidipropionici]